MILTRGIFRSNVPHDHCISALLQISTWPLATAIPVALLHLPFIQPLVHRVIIPFTALLSVASALHRSQVCPTRRLVAFTSPPSIAAVPPFHVVNPLGPKTYTLLLRLNRSIGARCGSAGAANLHQEFNRRVFEGSTSSALPSICFNRHAEALHLRYRRSIFD